MRLESAIVRLITSGVIGYTVALIFFRPPAQIFAIFSYVVIFGIMATFKKSPLYDATSKTYGEEVALRIWIDVGYDLLKRFILVALLARAIHYANSVLWQH